MRVDYFKKCPPKSDRAVRQPSSCMDLRKYCSNEVSNSSLAVLSFLEGPLPTANVFEGVKSVGELGVLSKRRVVYIVLGMFSSRRGWGLGRSRVKCDYRLRVH